MLSLFKLYLFDEVEYGAPLLLKFVDTYTKLHVVVGVLLIVLDCLLIDHPQRILFTFNRLQGMLYKTQI